MNLIILVSMMIYEVETQNDHHDHHDIYYDDCDYKIDFYFDHDDANVDHDDDDLATIVNHLCDISSKQESSSRED